MDGIVRRHGAHERELEQGKPGCQRKQAVGQRRAEAEPGKEEDGKEKSGEAQLPNVFHMPEYRLLGSW